MWLLLRKEILHIIRDKGLVIFILYAFTLDIYMAAVGFRFIPEMVSITVHDEDQTAASRELISRFQPPAFQLPRIASNLKEVDRLLDESDTVIAVVIPPGFQRDLKRGGAELQVLVDGTQSTAAYLSSAYLNAIVGRYSAQVLAGGHLPEGVVDLRSRVLFNPNVSDKLFEGLNEFFMVVTLIGMILPAAVLIREKEYGTIEQIIISPLSTGRFIFMKVLVSALFLLTMITLCYEFILGLVLGFPLKGGLPAFLFINSVFILSTTGLAFIIASVSKRFSHIGMLTIAIFAPMLLLSGGWVPPEALPAWLRSMTFISPLKHYMELGIGLLIRGSGFDILFPRMLRLLALGAVLLSTGCVLYIRRIIPGK